MDKTSINQIKHFIYTYENTVFENNKEAFLKAFKEQFHSLVKEIIYHSEDKKEEIVQFIIKNGFFLYEDIKQDKLENLSGKNEMEKMINYLKTREDYKLNHILNDHFVAMDEECFMNQVENLIKLWI
jgi:hypothetical protein